MRSRPGQQFSSHDFAAGSAPQLQIGGQSLWWVWAVGTGVPLNGNEGHVYLRGAAEAISL
jgi:hypothetical protein